MKLYSTNSPNKFVSLKEAVIKGLPDDNGLFMPSEIPTLSKTFIEQLEQYSFTAIAFEICKNLLGNTIPENILYELVKKAVNFPAPIVQLDQSKYVLELFHGPSLAFKDFGARFMAELMSYFNEKEEKELTILVATSGDTGGAVAAGFYKTPGINVIILYPSGKVSHLQEQQLTTLGENITALEIDGTFDDCQAMVKQAFLDKELNNHLRLSSANSINIARLIPQSFYYFEAYKQLPKDNRDTVFCVPSGNFGNLTAGLFAQKMGLPIQHFIAATNANDVVPEYLSTGEYKPRPSVQTISNAMDVGSPSNFVRMLNLCSTWNIMKDTISGYTCSDTLTKAGIENVKNRYDYIIDPHGAVAYNAVESYQKKHTNTKSVILETAHYSKFIDIVEPVLKEKVPIPERLAVLADKKKEAIEMNNTFENFKSWLLEHR